MTFKDMKIAITDEVHLKAVCDVLESMGYTKQSVYWDNCIDASIVCACEDGDMMDFTEWKIGVDALSAYEEVTLTDLLALRDKQFMEKIHA